MHHNKVISKNGKTKSQINKNQQAKVNTISKHIITVNAHVFIETYRYSTV